MQNDGLQNEKKAQELLVLALDRHENGDQCWEALKVRQAEVDGDENDESRIPGARREPAPLKGGREGGEETRASAAAQGDERREGKERVI